MLDKQTARELVKFVNDTYAMEDLEKYLNSRINYLRDRLELSTDIREVNNLQGALKELRRFKNLRDEVLQKANENG